ncbi:MAG: hypothetical protein QXU18_03635 [Thermoplasmatales archaeon]
MDPVESEKDLERYRKLFAIKKKRNEIEHADIRDLTVLPARSFGLLYASRIMIHHKGLDGVFKMLGDDSNILLLSIISRLTDPGSGISPFRYIKKTYFPEIKDLKKDRVYGMLDHLTAMKD